MDNRSASARSCRGQHSPRRPRPPLQQTAHAARWVSWLVSDARASRMRIERAIRTRAGAAAGPRFRGAPPTGPVALGPHPVLGRPSLLYVEY
eukprot:scaffold1536_cov397-Prasinococcus_capsulatus_cf.AAC.23